MTVPMTLQVLISIAVIAYGLVKLVKCIVISSPSDWVIIVYAIVESVGWTFLIRFFVNR